MTKEQFCKKYGLTSEQFSGEEWIKRNLTIYEDELLDGFNPKVTGYLDLVNVKTVPIWFNPVVRYSLYLPSVISFNPSFNPVVGTSLRLNSLTEIPFGWKPMVGTEIRLPSIVTLPDWFEPVALRVWFNRFDEYTDKFRSENGFFSWQNGQYIKVDGVATEVVEKRGKVYHVKHFGKDEIFYLVTDGNGVFVHGDTLNEAKENLNIRLSKTRRYNLHLTSLIKMVRKLFSWLASIFRGKVKTESPPTPSKSLIFHQLLSQNNKKPFYDGNKPLKVYLKNRELLFEGTTTTYVDSRETLPITIKKTDLDGIYSITINNLSKTDYTIFESNIVCGFNLSFMTSENDDNVGYGWMMTFNYDPVNYTIGQMKFSIDDTTMRYSTTFNAKLSKVGHIFEKYGGKRPKLEGKQTISYPKSIINEAKLKAGLDKNLFDDLIISTPIVDSGNNNVINLVFDQNLPPLGDNLIATITEYGYRFDFKLSTKYDDLIFFLSTFEEKIVDLITVKLEEINRNNENKIKNLIQ